MKPSQKRVDSIGRAIAGSQLQMQIYVARRQRELSLQILQVLGFSCITCTIEWVSPREHCRFAEAFDLSFLRALGLSKHWPKLRHFWPRGGPHWDALGRLHRRGADDAVLLVEAKSYPQEIRGQGCQAKALASKETIGRSLKNARAWFQADPDANWLGPLYQYANRLAHLYFFRQCLHIDAWLINVYFTDDLTSHNPTSKAVWEKELPSVKRELGFSGSSIQWVHDVFLPARDRSELFTSP
jgi:hypothetical protein